MTKEEALYCMKANSVLHSEICEECPFYGDTSYCFEDALDEVIKALEQKPCEDAVSRNLIIQMLNKMDRYVAEELTLCDADKKFPKNEVFIVDDVYEQIVEQLPSVNPQYTEDEIQKMQDLEQAEIEKAYELGKAVQPKTGHWIFDEILDKHYYCSECKSMGVDYWDYCPYCGAKMIETQERETWNGIHAQITAPKGTFERIFNDANDKNDI